MIPEEVVEISRLQFAAVVLYHLPLVMTDRKATDEQIETVYRIAQIHDFIHSLPKGYDTWMGEAGFTLSGGQLKYLTIARALLKNTPILILDEPENVFIAKLKSNVNAIFFLSKTTEHHIYYSQTNRATSC